jgi:hypothetical protein
MNSFGFPFPVPLLETAQVQRTVDEYGNNPFPIALLQMPMESISWLLYQVETARQIVEWTPLSSGPGTRVSYEGAEGWDGTKFRHEGDITEFANPFGVTNFWWGGQYATPQAARDGLRGYNALTTDDPTSENWPYDGKPGTWLGVGRFSVMDTQGDGTRRYDGTSNWPAIKTVFSNNVQSALVAWGTRLDNWLDSENAKVPKNLPLIADIERQITVKTALATQITAAANGTVAAAEASRQAQIDLGVPEAVANRNATHFLYLENDGYQRWVAGEEILEAFSVVTMPLNLFRLNFADWVKFVLSRQWFGRDFTGGFGSYFGDEIRFLGAGLTTAALGPLTTADLPTLASNALPALSTGQIAVCLTRPLTQIQNFVEPYGYNSGFQTTFSQQFFELGSDQLPVLVSEQLTAIGPAAIGLSAEACNVEPNVGIPAFESGVTGFPNTPSLSLLPGVQVGLFRIEDGSALGTQTLPGLKIYECPLFANQNRVGGLNITWRILSTRP